MSGQQVAQLGDSSHVLLSLGDELLRKEDLTPQHLDGALPANFLVRSFRATV